MRIAEIFESISGEVNGHHQGRICTFLRTSGCNLRCDYCDTPETQDSNYGYTISLDLVMEKITQLKHKYICVTGGEPLLHKTEMLPFLETLYYNNFLVSVETNGTIDITPFFRFVDSFVLDFKIGVKNYKSIIKNYLHLRNTDVIKFVVGSENDVLNVTNNYSFLQHHYKDKTQKPVIAFSPIISEIFTPKILFECLKEQEIYNSLISLQMHKFTEFN